MSVTFQRITLPSASYQNKTNNVFRLSNPPLSCSFTNSLPHVGSISCNYVLMVRLESDLVKVLLAACNGELSGVTLNWSPGSAMVVVMASQGYPGSYEKGTVIQNLEEAENVAPTVKIFHAGTTLDKENNFVAMGGRVLGVTAKGNNLEEARDKAYEAVEQINWPGGFYRRDIGWRALPQKATTKN